jgi:hypothetical protein
VYIFVNNNTNFNFLKILSNYTIWDRLSQKTISRYRPFKRAIGRGGDLKIETFLGPENGNEGSERHLGPKNTNVSH